MLEQMGSLTMPTPNHIKKLLNLLSTIDSLKKLQSVYKNFIEKAEHDSFSEDGMVEFCKKHIEDIEKKIKELLKKAEMELIKLGYKAQLANLRTIPAVGKMVSVYLVLFFLDLQSK